MFTGWLPILAAKGPSPEESLIFVVIVILFVIAVCVNGMATYEVVIRNGVPYCPRCNRQVTYRRDHCRACGYQYKRFGGGFTERQSAGADKGFEHWIKCNAWDKDRYNVDGTPNETSGFSTVSVIREQLDSKLLGRFKTDLTFIPVGDDLRYVAVLRRDRPGYESHIAGYWDPTRNGFLVRVPGRDFEVLITFPRKGIAAWDALMRTLCQIDASVIQAKGSRAAPLEFVPSQDLTTVEASTQVLQGSNLSLQKKHLEFAPWYERKLTRPDAYVGDTPVRTALPPPPPAPPQESERARRRREAREKRHERLRELGITPGPFAWYWLMPDWAQPIVIGVAASLFFLTVMWATYRLAS